MRHRIRTTVTTALSAVLAGAALATTAPAQAADADFRYVALGDSYTAAPLVPEVIPAGGCIRSTQNYPHLIAAALGVTDFADVSCSGADTPDMWASQLAGIPPQLDAVTADTDLVTVSIGGNDFSVFGTLVAYCPTLRASDPTGDPCRDAMRADGRDRLLAAVHETRDRIVAVLQEVRRRAPQARIVVVGYPQIAPRDGACPDRLPLADGDVAYAVQVNQRLTQALRQAAARTGADYVDVWRASQGHDVCSADPWINGQYFSPVAAPYHPFASEQAAVAQLVLDEID